MAHGQSGLTMLPSRSVLLGVAVAALLGTQAVPVWLVIVATLAAVVLGTQARMRQSRIELRCARKLWASFRSQAAASHVGRHVSSR